MSPGMLNVRPEWVDAPPVGNVAVATMADFAYEQTADVLTVEPALAVLARLVERAVPTEEEWRTVERLACLLVGPHRKAEQVGATDSLSLGTRPALLGATTRNRYISALHALVDEPTQ
jgi:hypothetical protein